MEFDLGNDGFEHLIEEAKEKTISGLPGVPTSGISFKPDGNILTNEEELDSIFLNPLVKDRQIVILSIVGETRRGKSFLLNYFLRFLYYYYPSVNTVNQVPNKSSHNELDAWLGGSDSPLYGFDWLHNINRVTEGIIFWNDVFLYDSNDGKHYAIVLVDTQGFGDFETSDTINTKIFSLITLMSSIIIFNIKDCNEDHLKQLQFATTFSQLVVKDEDNASIPFQHLLFLTRDWENEEDYEFGYAGGNRYLDEVVLKIRDNHIEPMKEVRRYIRNSFERIDGFLLPHPGKQIKKKIYNGNWGELDKDFLKQISILVPSLLLPQILTSKRVGGIEVTAGTLYSNLKAYINEFDNSKTLPSIQSLHEITATSFLADLVWKHVEIYNKHMELNLFKMKTNEEFQNLHLESEESVFESFDTTKKLGSTANQNEYRQKLKTEVQKKFENHAEKFTSLINIKSEQEQSLELQKYESERVTTQDELAELMSQLLECNRETQRQRVEFEDNMRVLLWNLIKAIKEDNRIQISQLENRIADIEENRCQNNIAFAHHKTVKFNGPFGIKYEYSSSNTPIRND